MSIITEDTIVIKREAEEKLKSDFETGREWCRIQNEKCVFRNKDYAVYVFDTDGGQPWDVMFGSEYEKLQLTSSDIVVTETNYLDDEKPWTRAGGVDIDESLIEYAKNLFEKDEWEEINEKIMYSNAETIGKAGKDDDIEFISCLRLVSDSEELSEEEREAIIYQADNYISHVSARRYCDMTEEFFLAGQADLNFLYKYEVEEEDYILFDALVASYRRACVSIFGDGVLPHTEFYDEINATEENMTKYPFDYLGYQTHVFLRSITTKKSEEVLSYLANDKFLVKQANEYLKRIEDPEIDILQTPADQIKKCLAALEERFVFSIYGMQMGDEPTITTAVNAQSAIFRKKLAEEGTGKIPMGAFLSKDEIKDLVQRRKQVKERQAKSLQR